MPTEAPTSVDILKRIIAEKAAGEERPQQEVAVREIESAIVERRNLLVEAPTGSGKSLAVLVPSIVTGARVVISTATKQLSEQITNTDIPFLKQAVKKAAPGTTFSASLLKGRDNYFCWLKDNEAAKLSAPGSSLFEDDTLTGSSAKMAKEIKALKAWADDSKTGDRAEAPPVSDLIWRQYSATATECVGRAACPFGDICFAEAARDRARKTQIVVANHALVGHDLMSEGESVLGEREVYIFDELHELDNYLSSAWGTQLTEKMIRDTHKALASYRDFPQADLEAIDKVGKRFGRVLEKLDEGLIKQMPDEVTTLLNTLFTATNRISQAAQKELQEQGISESLKAALLVLRKRADELISATTLLLEASVETVRWKRTSERDSVSLNAAPLRVGPRLQGALSDRSAIMIGTSATIRVGGNFEIPDHNLGFDELAPEQHREIALTSPFDFQKQAMLYIPHPEAFPAPVGADRRDHAEAVLVGMEELVRASGGRALLLSTTNAGAGAIAAHMRQQFPRLTILQQGDAPNSQLVEDFKRKETSVLVATMGMWQGLDVSGPACTLVCIDKIPFKPMNDPLSLARQNYATEKGRNGFTDVYVADAAIALAQGVGRLVRSQSDKGVVAIFDTRLLTKQYGPSMIRSLPDMKLFTKLGTVTGALQRLVASY